MAALGLLVQQPGSGYDLLRRFEKSMANVWPATQSQLYGELNKLAAAGLIEVSAVGPRGRKEYRATDAGRAELLRVFLLGELPPEQAREHLVMLASHSDGEVERLRALEAAIDWAGEPGADVFSHAALDYGLRMHTMQAQWARDVIARMDTNR